ncbi:MAG TPA: hypothetical protein DEP03_14250 [Massilia sp.]|nr:hypothetical protein [Massilia sp.]
MPSRNFRASFNYFCSVGVIVARATLHLDELALPPQVRAVEPERYAAAIAPIDMQVQRPARIAHQTAAHPLLRAFRGGLVNIEFVAQTTDVVRVLAAH